MVAKARKDSESVRTTIPEKSVKELGIKVGDVLDWEVETKGNRKVLVVKKLQ